MVGQEVGPYYAPSGPTRDAIKEEILNAVAQNPNQDPCTTIENGVIQSGREHLNIAITLVTMVREGEIGLVNGEWKAVFHEFNPSQTQ